MEAVKKGYTVCFERITQLMKYLNQAEVQQTSAFRLRKIRKSHVLIIDEIGYTPIGQREANLFFSLISDMYEQQSIIVTSNKTFSNWAEMMGEPDHDNGYAGSTSPSCPDVLLEWRVLSNTTDEGGVIFSYAIWSIKISVMWLKLLAISLSIFSKVSFPLYLLHSSTRLLNLNIDLTDFSSLIPYLLRSL